MIKRFYILLLAIVASVGMSWATTTDLASITDNYTAQDGEILTGTLGVNVKISIADGATVTLLNANINGDKTWTTGEYAGLTCLGDATITIVGKNSVSGFYADDLGNGFPGIYVPSGKTLIINGTGSLTAQSSVGDAAGIGARKDTHCGNIEIQSGKITAIACGEYGAGIGGAYNANCGNITISGGIVTAVGGDHCAGIGGGRRGASTNAGHCGNILISGGVVSATSGEQAAAIGGGRGNNNNYKTNCGTITITNTALKVYADQGGSSTNTIGAAKYGNCGAVTIGDNTGAINNDPYTYRTKEDGEIVVDYINAIGTVVYTQECKDKIDIARELYDALEDSQKTLVTNYQVLLDAEAAYAALIPQPGSAATVWTSLAVGDVIKVGDQLSPSVEWESANDYGVIKPAWAPYTLLRANIVQEHEYDDPVVTEAEDGAYYVLKFTHPSAGTYYLLANSAKGTLLAATATSDGLEVTNVGDYYGTPQFTFAVHDGGGSSAPAWVKAGDVWDEDTKTLTVNSNPGTEAYYQNTEIEHLIISDGVTTIGESAFDECTALLSVVIGNDVTNIEANAFDECGAMTSLTIGNKVQTIGESAFGSCESLTSVIIPNSVTSIGNSAFNTCDKMSSLTIGSGVQTIGESAFKNCSMLTDVTIPASVENIGAWFFRNCENLATITCKATTPPTLGNNAFFDCDKLTHIYVPAASVATYKAADNWATKEAIISAPPANSITINGTPQVGDNSISLTYYFDPGNVSGICCYAPTLKVKCVTDNNWDEKWLILEDISSGTETITLNTLGSFQAGKEYAICYAYHTESWVDEVFQSFSFPAAPANSCGGGLTWELNNGALTISYDGEGTGVMNDYDIPNDNPAPWYANRENITSVSLPEGIKTIGKDAFRDCVNLTTVTIPNSVTTIGESAFVTVEHLETVTIGTGITSIVNGAFYGNAELTTVTCSATTPPSIGEMVFGSCTNLEHIYVPAESVDAYKTAWSAYASLISAAGGGSTTDPIVIATNTEQSSYTQGSITVSVGNVGDNDGFRLNDANPASISNSGSSTISKIELVPGWFLNQHANVRANGAEPNSSSEELITFLNVNSNEVTISCSASIYIKEVRIYFEEAGGGSTDVIPCTAADLGKVLCTDGSIYATVSEATAASKTAVAMIAYVDTQNGKALALALADDGGTMEWATAKTTAAAHTPAVSGGTWTLASKDDWDNMINAAGSYTALRDGFSAVGGTNMQEDKYWSSTPESDKAWCYYFNYGMWVDGYVDNPCYVRACLAFDIPAAPAYETVMNLINEIPNPVVLTAECKAKIDAARAAYDALSDGDKDLVTNSATLTTAEAAYAGLLAEKVAPVIAAIDAVPATPLTDATKKLSEYNKVTDARALYDALTDEEKAAVGNYSKLTDAEEAFAAIPSVGSETVITWDKNTGIEKISGTATSPAYEGITISIKGGGFGPQDDMLRFNIAGLGLSFEFANTLGGNFQKIVISSTNAMPSTPLAGMGEGWAASNENKTATWTGDAANVKIWDGLTATSFWDVNTIQFTLGATVSATEAAQATLDKINAIPDPVTLDEACVKAIKDAREAVTALGESSSLIDAADMTKLTKAEADYIALIQAEADEVIAKIAAIPQPVTLKLATRDSIESARAAYDALTADQKLLVGNYAILEAAEAAWAGLINVAPAGALSGKYTINDGGDVIYFAHGNLQYTRENLDADWSTGTFRLAENQYDLIELVGTYPAAYCTDNYGDKTAVGLFGWGTWGEGKTPNLTSSDRTLYTWSTDFSGTLEGTSTWRTLTKDEWVYLLAHNNQSYATVHGVNGLLVAPDGKDIEGKSMADWVVINDETWTTMQNDGYLFLPACGQRSQMSATANITTGDQGEDVVYYSSTQNTDATAYNIWYKPGQAPAADDYSNKRQAFGVRLVSAGVNPLDQVQVVKGLIEAIPAEITLDAACVNAIQSARAGYDALDTDAKAILDAADVQKLNDAEAALTALNQAVADEVIAKINNIPTPVELKLATRDSINNARAAYDALNAAQQALVPAADLQKLTDAEAALAEKNQGGSASVDIVWDINTGIESVATNTTSPAYDGITITTGNGNRFYQTTQDPIMLRFFFTGGKGRYAFAQEDGTHFTKVALISSVAMGEWLREPSRIGTDWVVSDDYKKATWTGDADTVKIWDGAGATAWVDVDSIVFTVNASSTPLDSAQTVKGQIEAIREPLDATEACGAEIAAALDAYDALSDAAKGALDAADVQKLNDAATQYPALDAIAAIEAIPDEITYDPMTKSYIEIAKTKYDALSDASKALVNTEDVQKLTNALEAWAILVAKIEHNVSYIGKDGELKNEKVALLHIPDPAPDFNGYEFVRWDVKGGDFLEEGLRIKAVYTPIITTNPAAYDTLVYNGTAQTLVIPGVAKEGHIEYSLYPEEPESWSANLPTATNAAAYVVYYKLVREGHEDYMAGSVNVTIAKAPVTYTAPTAVESLVYNASNQTLIAAGQTNDGTFEYTFAPNDEESWNTELPQAKDAGTYSVYFRVVGDLNHLDSTAVDPIAVTIAKAELTATADNKAIIFGELAPQFTVTYAGWQGDDDASVLTGEIAYACEYVKGNPVGEYVITPSGVDAANYTIEFVKGKLTVNRKSAKSADITAAQLLDENLVYTNAVNRPTIVVMDTTLQLTEVKDYTLSFVGRGETQYAESATAPIHVGEYTAIVAFVGNYKDTLTVDFAIAKAPLTITAENKEVIFGENAPVFTVAYTGFLGNDTATVLTGTQEYACEYVRGNDVGDYKIIPSGVDAHDYAISFVNGTLTVNRKSAKSADIVAAQLAGEKLIYTNAVNRPTIVVTDTTLTLTEDKDYVLTFIGTANDASVYEESAVAPTKAGDYTAIVAFVGNYIDTLTVDFTISKAPLTITADDKEMIYGDEHPEFTVSYDGFLGTDDNSVLLGTQGYSCVYAPGSYIGTYAITPKDVEAYDYEITFVDGTLTVNKAVVSISGAEAQCAKFADGHAQAVVLQQGTLNGIKLNDPIAHVTTAAYSSADVAEHLTVTLFYELTGDAALLTNYDLQPTSEVFSTEGVIIEPMIPDDQPAEKEDEETEIEEGIEVYAYGYCDGSGYSLRYHLETGIPDQYKIEFADSRFADIDWTNLEVKGPDGHIDILIPVDLPTGDYTMTVTFRDSRFTWLESKPFDVTFHVNLPETFITPLFNNTIALVDTCNCFTDIQWYWRADDTQLWQPIEGATGHYYRPEGGAKLTGEYFVQARMNGEPTYTCGQADMETLYGAEKQAKVAVKAFPNPVVNTTTVTIENSENWNHSLRVVNLTGVEMFRTTFEGNETVVRMDGYVQGNYMISVDGIVVKVMKK